MKKIILVMSLLCSINNFAYNCEVVVLNPKNQKTQKVPFKLGEKKDFGFKNHEYQCAVTTSETSQKNIKSINLACIIPNTKLVTMTSGIVGLDYPVPANLYLQDRKGNERKLIMVCQK